MPLAEAARWLGEILLPKPQRFPLEPSPSFTADFPLRQIGGRRGALRLGVQLVP